MKISRIKYVVLFFALLAFGAAIVIYPERYVESCFRGFALWAECVLPSLFPFMIIAMLLIKTGLAERASLPLKRVTGAFGLPPCAAACFFMSILSGYPAGSRIVLEFYEGGALTKSETAKLSYICSTSGPLFIIGSVGFRMFGDKIIGVKILLAHALATVTVGLILSLFSKEKRTDSSLRRQTDKNLLYNTFYSAIISVTVAGGFIAFFYVVAQFCADFNILYPAERLFSAIVNGEAASALSMGLIEATTGCSALAASGDRLSAALAGFTITLGGASILAQQLSYLTKGGVRPLRFIAVKSVQALLCFLILLPLTLF